MLTVTSPCQSCSSRILSVLKASHRLNARNSLRGREPLSLPHLETGSAMNPRHVLSIGNAETRRSVPNGNYSKCDQTASNESVGVYCDRCVFLADGDLSISQAFHESRAGR